MNPRRPPRELYEAVLELTAAIAQPYLRGEVGIYSAEADDARIRLRALFDARERAGAPDPFLTEAMADFTHDRPEAARLYRLAISQCAAFPDEPIHTKRQALVEVLLELGQVSEARGELALARREAFAAGDTGTLRELEILALAMPADDSR